MLSAMFWIMSNCQVKNNKERNVKKLPQPLNQTTKMEKKATLDTNKYTLHKYLFNMDIDYATASYYLSNQHLQTHRKMDILYYYNRLPPFCLCSPPSNGFQLFIEQGRYQSEKIPSSFYSNRIAYNNIKNGYLKVKACKERVNIENNFGNTDNLLELALFTSSARNVVAVNSLQEGKLRFLTLSGGASNNSSIIWEDVTSGIFPSDFSKSFTFFKLPEYGTTILACRDTAKFIADPDKFWADKQQNHPEEIIKIVWNVEQGRFFIK